MYNWTNRVTLEAAKQDCPDPWKLPPEALEQYPDAYLRERTMALRVSDFVIRCGLKRLGIRRKKTLLYRERNDGRRNEYLKTLDSIPDVKLNPWAQRIFQRLVLHLIPPQ